MMYRPEYRGNVWILIDPGTGQRVGPPFKGKQEAVRYSQSHDHLEHTGSAPPIQYHAEAVDLGAKPASGEHLGAAGHSPKPARKPVKRKKVARKPVKKQRHKG